MANPNALPTPAQTPSDVYYANQRLEGPSTANSTPANTPAGHAAITQPPPGQPAPAPQPPPNRPSRPQYQFTPRRQIYGPDPTDPTGSRVAVVYPTPGIECIADPGPVAISSLLSTPAPAQPTINPHPCPPLPYSHHLVWAHHQHNRDPSFTNPVVARPTPETKEGKAWAFTSLINYELQRVESPLSDDLFKQFVSDTMFYLHPHNNNMMLWTTGDWINLGCAVMMTAKWWSDVKAYTERRLFEDLGVKLEVRDVARRTTVELWDLLAGGYYNARLNGQHH